MSSPLDLGTMQQHLLPTSSAPRNSVAEGTFHGYNKPNNKPLFEALSNTERESSNLNDLQPGITLPYQQQHHHQLDNPRNHQDGSQNQSDLIHALQTQQEVITDLKIRVAVLSHDLERAEKAREAAVSAAVAIAQSLAGAMAMVAVPVSTKLNSNPSEDVTIVERERVAVCSEVLSAPGSKRWGLGGEMDRRPDGKLLLGESLIGGELGLSTSSSRIQEGVVTNHDLLKDCEVSEDDDELRKCKAARSISRRIEDGIGFCAAAGGCVESFETGSTTVPNSPIINRPSDADLQDAQIGKPYVSSGLVEDVGFDILDEVLSSDTEDFPPSLKSSAINTHPKAHRIGNNKGVPSFDTGIDIPEQSTRFDGLPAPSVLKTGFEAHLSFRGDEYNYETSRSDAHPNSMSSHGRFVSSYPPRHTSGLSSSFEQRLPLDSRTPFDTSKTSSGEESLWSSAEERDAVIHQHRLMSGPQDSRFFPGFFRYGITYKPGDDDTNFFRTVRIGNLPRDIELKDVLARVRGGDVSSAILANTVSITGSVTAIVVFVQESAAEDYVSYVSEHPVSFGADSLVAEVALVDTPTWPAPPKSKKRLVHSKPTRCLAIHYLPSHLSVETLVLELAYGNVYRAAGLLEVFVTGDDEVSGQGDLICIEFASLNAAGSAYGILTKWDIFRGVEVEYAEDPCARSLGDLQFPVGPRKSVSLPMQVSTLRQSSSSSRVGQVIATPRKQLTALSSQNLEIPSFSGASLRERSWADEVIDEAKANVEENGEPHSAAPPNTPTLELREENGMENALGAIMLDGINVLMKENPIFFKDEVFRKPPVGLAGSKYATRVPRFSDKVLPVRSRSNTLLPPDQRPRVPDSEEVMCAERPATLPALSTRAEEGVILSTSHIDELQPKSGGSCNASTITSAISQLAKPPISTFKSPPTLSLNCAINHRPYTAEATNINPHSPISGNPPPVPPNTPHAQQTSDEMRMYHPQSEKKEKQYIHSIAPMRQDLATLQLSKPSSQNQLPHSNLLQDPPELNRPDVPDLPLLPADHVNADQPRILSEVASPFAKGRHLEDPSVVRDGEMGDLLGGVLGMNPDEIELGFGDED